MATKKPTNTITITNFGGRLTRILSGDLNSGFAKFTTSFGYDPFSKPMNLTWLETATDITGPITSLPQAGKVLSSSLNGPNVHVIDQNGKWYQILSGSLSPLNPNLNSVIGIASIFPGGNYEFGTSMEFYGSVVGQDLAGNRLGKLYVGNDFGVRSINPDGSGEAIVGSGANYTLNIYHPLQPFAGSLIFGNGNTIGEIDNTGIVVSSVIGTGTSAGIYSALNPPLETNAKVLDLEVTPSNDYLVMASSQILQEERLDAVGYDIVQTFSSQGGKINQWNGSDVTVTTATSVPTYLLSGIQTYFKNMSFFGGDTFGTAFNDGSSKLLSLPNNKPPLPNAIANNANFITWTNPETVGTARFLSLYYFGALDEENPQGLYRLLRWQTTQSSGFVFQSPLNLVVSNQYQSINIAQTAIVTFGYGKHYIGVSSANSMGLQNFLLSFLTTPSGVGTPQFGVYETQTQLFSQRIEVNQMRVYTEPAVAGNAFQIDCIGSDGNVIPNGTFTYHFGEIADPQSGSTAIERINFNPNMKSQYSLGIRITNLGTTNMTIKKIELDIDEEGK